MHPADRSRPRRQGDCRRFRQIFLSGRTMPGGPGAAGNRPGFAKPVGMIRQENEPRKNGAASMYGVTQLAGNTAVLDVADKMLGCLPDKSRPAAHPLITPIGESRATRVERPASWTTCTTSLLGLYTSGASSAIAASLGARTMMP